MSTNTSTRTSASDGAFLRVEDIRKRFGAFEALKGVSLTVGEGQAMALIGPSGSGKSTVLRCINALETIDSGAILVGGQRIGSRLDGGRVVPLPAAEAARQREDIGMVFQSFNLFPHLDALGNVASGLLLVKQMKKREAHERAMALLERVGLAAKSGSFPRQLSGGQQQRVAIARALAMEPRLMLFDEPTSALDPETVQEVLNVIREVRETRMTMLIATHEMEFARRVSDVAVFMEAGQVVEQGPSEQVFLAPRTERCRRFLAGLVHGDASHQAGAVA